VLLTGHPDYICCCLDHLREAEDYLFRPGNTTRFAVYEIHSPQSVQIHLSIEANADIDHPCAGQFVDIGRVGVLLDDRLRGGTNCAMLVVHHFAIQDAATHRLVADVAAHITRGRETDMVFAPMRDLMQLARGQSRTRVCMYETADGGISWRIHDISHVLDDFLLHDNEEVTVRTGQRVARIRVVDLLGAIVTDQPAVQTEGVLVDCEVVLVHFKPPEIEEVSFSVFNVFTSITTVYGVAGELASFEADDGCLILDRRTKDIDTFPYVGIVQSGSRYFGAPLATTDVRRV
jgi:hypothetical protein